MEKRTVQITTRLTEAEARKLSALAEASLRSQSGVLRALLAHAEVAPTPDVRLAGSGKDREGDVTHAS